MPETDEHSVLRRKLRQGEPVAAPAADMSPGRALRLAISRAADRTVGLRLTVLGQSDEVMTLDGVIDEMNADHMLISVMSGDDLLGLLAIDPELRACLIEMQTMGNLSPVAAEPRKVTSADAALAAPVADAFLAMLNETAVGTQLAGWAAATQVGPPLECPRAAGLVLPDGAYRLVRLSLDFGIGERQGELCLALPEHRNPRAAPKDEQASAGWRNSFHEQVLGAQANVNAVLHKMRMPMAQVENLTLGQVIPLSGTRVTSVKLVGPDGQVITTARLGKMAGQRAVRVETGNADALDAVDQPDTRLAVTDTPEVSTPSDLPDSVQDLESAAS
ncbi:FliM/FliN family flagellar motor switch protein [Octadecabacter sp. R77987]|uniref:FliM/FliN family flagellar motor switch protein n=1 Tax=Octadecabacter sp. R77987 TaxID=3093874 RepID=UPI00366B2F41